MGNEQPSNRIEHKLRDLWLVAQHPLEQVIVWIQEEENITDENNSALLKALAWAHKAKARMEERAGGNQI